MSEAVTLAELQQRLTALEERNNAFVRSLKQVPAYGEDAERDAATDQTAASWRETGPLIADYVEAAGPTDDALEVAHRWVTARPYDIPSPMFDEPALESITRMGRVLQVHPKMREKLPPDWAGFDTVAS